MIGSEDFALQSVDVKMVRRKNKPVGPVAAKLWRLMQGHDKLAPNVRFGSLADENTRSE